jgi:predicted MFS family arabinose efflux permease
VAGLFLTPVAAASYLVVGAKARPAHRIEAFAWLSTALAVGGSAGSATAGAAVQHLGPVTAMALPAAVAAAAAAIALVWRRSTEAR